ncbi:D-alanyl-D-alanine carboxypeptidase/D-alanyl-D-alanine-endopeptidase [Thiomicrorhabdus sediminis]|uniref:D-alanyl-D-alanine carboxypeptidase/D-alanyl-D-alanine-endopeptidase n=1 Tax=Thiomicrorhabdus sediminis TaxID=2580412 RepID=UPI00143CEE78|nr:D-alanyl-D-alanine carboxypeptidase [Thiomicrorhabdus sediminis]
MLRKFLLMAALFFAASIAPASGAQNAPVNTAAQQNEKANAEQNVQSVLGRLAQQPAWQHFQSFAEAGFVIDTPQGIKRFNAGQAFVPASTTKLITALLALRHWGDAYRFKTEFYIKRTATQNILLVKGFGDPFLVSEELALIAQQLKQNLMQLQISHIDAIYLDDSFYQSDLIMPGTLWSDNPYDAIPSAIAANFNTINVKRVSRQGSIEIISAEAQTPITQTAQQFALTHKLKSSKALRINLGQDLSVNQRHFAELLAAFLQQESLTVGQTVANGVVDNTFQPLYSHDNSRTLADVIEPMMKYSTNFIANQLALNLAADQFGAPANPKKVAKLYQQALQQLFGWQDFLVEDGAGLSRQNRLSPDQLLEVLQAFKPWRYLLPQVENHVVAKSGSLIGVSTLAGFYQYKNTSLPFVIMINEQGPYRLRNRLARELAEFYRR